MVEKVILTSKTVVLESMVSNGQMYARFPSRVLLFPR